jgi:ribosomal protein S18 acetylase RimI-like enzyme
MLTLRQATLNDLEALVQLRLELLREVGNLKDDTDTAALAKAIQQYLGEKMPRGEFLAWVAQVDRQIVATSGAIVFQRPPIDGNLSGWETYVMNIYTLPQWRRKGIATALLEEIIRFVQATNARRIWLHASEDGKHLYEKFGFVSTATEMELVW